MEPVLGSRDDKMIMSQQGSNPLFNNVNRILSAIGMFTVQMHCSRFCNFKFYRNFSISYVTRACLK